MVSLMSDENWWETFKSFYYGAIRQMVRHIYVIVQCHSRDVFNYNFWSKCFAWRTVAYLIPVRWWCVALRCPLETCSLILSVPFTGNWFKLWVALSIKSQGLLKSITRFCNLIQDLTFRFYFRIQVGCSSEMLSNIFIVAFISLLIKENNAGNLSYYFYCH